MNRTELNFISRGSASIDGNLDVKTSLNVLSNVSITGIVTVASGSYLRNVRVGVADANTINTTTGNLIIDSATNIVDINARTNINDAFSVSGITTFASLVDANGGAEIDNVRIGILDNNTIDTSSGNLSIGAAVASRVAITTNTTIVGVLSVTDDITAFWSSDQRLKDNIIPIEQPLNKVLSISGNTFDWNEKSNKSGHDVGVIAQEILEVLPEACYNKRFWIPSS